MSTRTGGIVAVYAHPDDESFGPAGTLARYASAGVPAALVCVTRGDVGEAADPPPEAREALAALRSGELRRAADAIGIGEVVFLDYPDGAVAAADAAELTARIAAELRRLAPAAILTFGPRGVNDHPDHVATHHAARAAFEALRGEPGAPGALYYHAFTPEMARERGLDGPEARPTTAIATGPFVDAKIAALDAHRSQTDAREMTARVRRERPAIERYHRAYPPPPAGSPDTPHEDAFHGLPLPPL